MGMVGCFAAVTPSKLQLIKSDPESVNGYLNPDDGDPPFYVEVDKAWHAIHFMLCGNADPGEDPQSQAILGGTEIGEDWGYGPPRYLLPHEVKEVASYLEPLTPELFAKRYDPTAMDTEGIYPEIWERDGADGLEYVLEYYQQFRQFYLDAKSRGDAAFLWLS